MLKKRLILAGGAVLAVAATLSFAACSETTTAQQDRTSQTEGITVAGMGKATAEPDLAQLRLGVSVLAPSVAEARQQAANSMQQIIDSLKNNGVEDDDIQTEQLHIAPEYDFRDGEQILRGFRVQNIVSAKVREIDTTSKVVDDAVAAGGNNVTIQSIAFSIDDPSELATQARQQAVEDARAKAETLADAAGVSVGDPIAITEGGGQGPVPMPFAADRAAQEGASTPIQPGELDVVVNVSVTWAIE